MRLTKKIVLFFMTFLSLASMAEEIEMKIDVPVNPNIEFIAVHGQFSITVWDQAYIELRGQLAEEVQYEQQGPVVQVILNSTNSTNSAQNSENEDYLDIRVPDNAQIGFKSNSADFSFDGLHSSLSGSTESGDVFLKNFESQLSVTTINGGVRLNDASGEFSIETVNGRIEIKDSTGIANISSVSGDQHIESDLRRIVSSNVSGDSSLQLRTIEKLNLKNVNGDSIVETAVSNGADIQMQSVSGDLVLRMPEETSARVAIQSHNGGLILNGFDDHGQQPSVSKLNFDLANANANITMNTMEGNIEVLPGHKRDTAESKEESKEEEFDWSSVDTSILDFAYISPSYTIFDFDKIYIKAPEIEFDTRWIAEFGDRKTEAYRERIKKEYSDLLTQTIKDTFLKETNLTISDTRGENVLVIIPKILNLNIETPEINAIGDFIITTPAGSAEIDLVIFSPEHQSILGLFMDNRSTGKPTHIAPSKLRTINTREFDRLFDDWVQDIIEVIENKM